ncbi:hypothetical protein Val02_71970 [Virgisporangium aliadipatigenens]|uniref:Uncharacterized protein n=1 Tax=Virgisporangium aliadipatigenens TaxID=741659 RepID=A0A8J3YRU1_9ACTN|nr:hypothetical protein [Virgisporangium aliadipatigenens]GIJ50311.1 hypothetical protein Val02_71970 [Virgisporangium aliadipatigenens]
MDLLDWHRGTLTSRRLRVLVQHLPADSSFGRAVNGEAAEWGVTEHLLAAVVDQLAAANWMFATVNRDEDAEALPYPEPLARPGLPAGVEPGSAAGPEESTSDGASSAEIAAFFGAP